MSGPATDPPPVGACSDCLRRSWLLARLSAALDYSCGRPASLIGLLALDDQALIDALAGTRRASLRSRYERFDAHEIDLGGRAGTVCRHDRRYPRALDEAGAPPMLHVLGGAARLGELAARPTVAIIGTPRASDHGMQMTTSLACGLAACGITVLSGLADGIPVAAHGGVLEAGGAAVAVIGGPLDRARPVRRRSLVKQLMVDGCIVSELPEGSEGRRWGPVAAERIIARLAHLTVVVEADVSPRELLGATIVRALGGTVAAFPGRVTSPVSRGTNALLMDGAHLVRGPEDVLELLPDGPREATVADRTVPTRLEPRLAKVLERVGAGTDTPEKLIAGAGDAGEVLLALSELELIGLLTRGDGGRYVAGAPTWGGSSRPTPRRAQTDRAARRESG
jgi:DNA processing protein